jgi:hypothetical protein
MPPNQFSSPTRRADAERNRDKILAAACSPPADRCSRPRSAPHEVRDDLTLDRILDMIVAIATVKRP